MIDVYEFFQHPVLVNDTIEEDRGDGHTIYYTKFLRDMDTEDSFWPFDFEAA